jgi:flagellar biosynthesis/type III secretory pathway M-ring protein FliF/YscJ
MSFGDYSSSYKSSSRRALTTSSITIDKSSFNSKEAESIYFNTLIEHSTNGDSFKDTESLGDLSITINYYGSTITVKDIKFKSYSEYKDQLDKYYYSRIERWTFIIFVLFSIWFFFHAIFLVLQVKYDIIAKLKKQLCEIKQEAEEQNITSKEDHVISDHILIDPKGKFICFIFFL